MCSNAVYDDGTAAAQLNGDHENIDMHEIVKRVSSLAIFCFD